MSCDSSLGWNAQENRKQTIKERVSEVQKVVEKVSALIGAGTVKVKVGPQGAVAFEGIPDAVRDRVTDACIYRRLLVSGSALVRAKVQQAEMMAGRKIDRQVLAAGTHSHDGGRSWHSGH